MSLRLPVLPYTYFHDTRGDSNSLTSQINATVNCLMTFVSNSVKIDHLLPKGNRIFRCEPNKRGADISGALPRVLASFPLNFIH